jgi:hypothetical protein
MAHHPELPKIDAAQTLPNPSFFSWLKSQTTLFVSQILGLFSVVLSLFYYGSGLYEHLHNSAEAIGSINRNIQIFVDFAHLVILFVFIVWLITVLDENDQGRYRVGLVYKQVFNESLSRIQRSSLRRTAKLQLRKFKNYFLCFWCVMWVLYAVFAFKHVSQETGAPAGPVITIQCSENLKGDCYNIPSIAGPNDASTFPCPPDVKGTCFNVPDLLTGSKLFWTTFYPFLTFALNNISLWFIYLCFTVLYLPSHDKKTRRKQSRHTYFSGFAVLIFTLAFPLLLTLKSASGFSASGLTNFFTLFDAISGILNAIVLALLIARLDSKLIGLPSRLICVLYCYSAVQPLFAVFEQPAAVFQTIQSFVLVSVFMFKVYFFLIIIFTLQTGRMLNYLFCFPYLDKRVDSIFENQFEIKSNREDEHCFRFSILKDNEMVYVNDSSSKTRGECDKRIEDLRKAMKDKLSYEAKEQAGTHWIEVKMGPNDVICHSIALRSQDEVRNLVEESIQKIPYCKYNRA